MRELDWYLEVENIYLDCFQPTHISESYLNALNDKSHMRFSRHRMNYHTTESALEFMGELQAKGDVFLGIFNKIDDEIMGTITITRCGKDISLGFLVLPFFASKGVLSQILPVLLDKMSSILNFNWIHIGTRIENTAMRRVAEKSGFIVVSDELIEKFVGSYINNQTKYTHLLKPNTHRN